MDGDGMSSVCTTRSAGLCFFNDAFEPDKHKQKFLKHEELFAAVTKLFFECDDKSVKSQVEKQKGLFLDQLSRWRQLDIEYCLDPQTQVWRGPTTITQLLVHEAEDQNPKETRDSIPPEVEKMFRERPDWKKYLRLKMTMPGRSVWNARR